MTQAETQQPTPTVRTNRQNQSDSIKELATALSAAQGEMHHAEKTATNPFFKSKYASLPAIIDAARPALAKHGLSIIQTTDLESSGMVLVTQLMHSSGEWIRSWYPIRPSRPDPQGLGSAVTYARRYAYQSIVGIAPSEDDSDDDGNGASGRMVATVLLTLASAAQAKRIRDLAAIYGMTDAQVSARVKEYGANSVEDLTESNAATILAKLEAAVKAMPPPAEPIILEEQIPY